MTVKILTLNYAKEIIFKHKLFEKICVACKKKIK